MVQAARGHSTQFIRRVNRSDVPHVVPMLAMACISSEASIEEVAGMFDVSRATVYNWLNGVSVPRAAQLDIMPKITSRLNKRK
jgi:transcriptional regulator with XRE-family HTH domain